MGDSETNAMNGIINSVKRPASKRRHGAMGHQRGVGKTATALHYQPGDADIAPVVIAQEQGDLAEQLLALARAKGVPITEDADLAALLQAASVGEEIPLEAFLVVAELFRYLYQHNDALVPQPEGEASPYWSGRDAHNQGETID